MSKYLLRFAAVLILVFAPAVTSFAIDPQETASSVAPDKLFHGADHQEIPWKVNFSSPRLMYQQVYLVEAKARIDPIALKRRSNTRNLHFVLKVQREDGKWADGGEYKDYKIPPDLGRDREIAYASAVYLRPGNYTLNLAVFDDKMGRSSVASEAIRIPKLHDDPFPELDELLAPAEFPNGFPLQEIENETPGDDGELFPISLKGDHIPIATAQPAVIDIVLDIAKRPKQEGMSPFVPFEPPPWRRRRSMPEIPTTPRIPSYDLEVGRLLQVGDLLSRLAPSAGCVRISAIDALRMKTVLERTDETKMDWLRFEEQIEKFDQETVDVRVLTNKKGPAQFMLGYLDALTADSSSCGAGARHYIIVVSHPIPFPANDDKLSSVDRERAQFYYLSNRRGGGIADDLAGLLKPVRPERLSFDSPRHFRKAIAKIVSDVKAVK